MNLLLFLLTSKYFMHNFYVHLRLTDLLHGRFPRLTDRLLGMEICDNSPGKVHTIFSAYMDRILIWNTLTEFILAIAPQLESLGQFLKFNRQSSRLRTTSVVACCGICGLSETNLPFITDPCSHIFCHFCIQNHLITSNECPLCQYTIDSIQYFDRT